MAFNRGNGFRADLVSETMTIRTFHFIERNITNYYEMILTDRKEATSWSRRWGRAMGFLRGLGGVRTAGSLTEGLVPCRMHLALKAYQELLLTVNEMDCSPDENIRQSSSVIKSESLVVVPQLHRLNFLSFCCVMF